jgi:hypothetical protein
MYPVKKCVTTKRGRRSVIYYRCRRASHNGTCDVRQLPAATLEPVIVAELEGLGLEASRWARLAQTAEAQFTAEVQPLVERRAELNRQLERLDSRAQTLLELVEERVIGKEEFAARKQQLETQRAAAHADLAAVDAEIQARDARDIDIQGSLRSIARVSDIYAELEEPAERRRLLETCLDRLIVGDGAVEVHVPVQSAIVITRGRCC